MRAISKHYPPWSSKVRTRFDGPDSFRGESDGSDLPLCNVLKDGGSGDHVPRGPIRRVPFQLSVNSKKAKQ